MALLLALYVSLFLLLKILLTDNALFFKFFIRTKKKVRRKHDDSRSIHRNMCFLLSFLLALNFFLLVLFSRVSMIIQGGTTTPRLCGYYCRPSRTEEKKIGEKESTRELDISYRTYERKKEMNPVTFVIYFGNYHEINAYFQRINLQCAPYEMTSSYI
jgi:hypothetical protein